MTWRFRDRAEAGRLLAQKLTAYADRPDVVVLALPRGGVPVAFQVAQALNAPLDILLVRKLGVPGHEEFAMGAIASGGVYVVNRDIVRSLGISASEIEEVTARERQELERRERVYRGGRPAPDVRGRTVIVVDDGLATGTTMRAAIALLRKQDVARIVVAIPVSPPMTCQEVEAEADKVVCVRMPEPFFAIGMWYERFPQTSDKEVRDLLERAASARLVPLHSA
jgi:putative phosphoribosyl transferase